MEKQHEPLLPKNEWRRVGLSMVGFLIHALGLNLFLVPLHLYSGGFTGIAQLLRTLLEVLGFSFGNIDVAGILYWVLNVPMFLLAYKGMHRTYLVKLLIGVSSLAVSMALVPVPEQPLVAEPLTGCLLGGIICGYGMGTYLTGGCSGGGMEVPGIYLSRKHPGVSVGKLSLAVNAVVFCACLLAFDPSVAIYSVIASALCSVVADRAHSQNVNVEAIILSKVGNQQIEARVLQELGRGITYWDARGGYTGDEIQVLYTVLSKYEVPHLRRIVQEENPQAFVVLKEGLTIRGHFIRNLS